MKKLSQLALGIRPSLTREFFNEAKNYDDVIDFTLGDPDIQTPEEIKKAGCEAINNNKTRYSQNAGLLELRKQIACYSAAKEGLDYKAESEVFVAVGAMEGIFLALFSILNPGDEVIIPAPYYINYKQIVELCRAIPVIVTGDDDLVCSENVIKESITSRTKAIILNTPNNPSGKVYSFDFLKHIADLVITNDLYVITDEVYKCLVYDNKPRPKSIATIKGMKERTVYVNSLSKEFCMTGWRLGYCLGPESIISAIIKLQENVAACAPLPSQYAAIEALRLDKNYSSAMISIFSRRRNVLFSELSKSSVLKPILPEATFYMLVDIRASGMKSIDFSYTLLREAHVAVVPGIAYGDVCDNYIRIAFTIDENKIREGVQRIINFTESFL